MTEHNRRSDDGEKSAVLVHLEYIRGAVDDLKKAVFGVDERGGLKTRVERLEGAHRAWSGILIFIGAPVLVIVIGLVAADVYSRVTRAPCPPQVVKANP